MSSSNPVLWQEGQPVAQHHMQQGARFLEYHVNRRMRAAGERLYGFTEITLNNEVLSFGRIAILRARGVMQDGTVFDIPGDTEAPAPLQVPRANAAGQRVYLALPLASDSGLDVQWDESGSSGRYRAKSRTVPDTHSPDGEPMAIDVAELRMRIMLHADDRSAYTSLALGRIVDVRADGSIMMDSLHYPTCCTIDAVPVLRQFLTEIAGNMRERALNIAARIGSPDQAGVADVADFNLLQTLNRLHAGFTHLTRLNHVHPQDAYAACACAYGELATFTTEQRVAEEYPAYQHEDLRASFEALERLLRRAMGTVLQPRAVPLRLEEGQYGTYTAIVADRSLFASADFILAVSTSLPQDELRAGFAQQVKVSSIEGVNELVRSHLTGVGLRPLPVVPRNLPHHSGYTYFELDRTSEHWQTLLDGTAGFGLHVAGHFPDLKMQFWAIREQ